MFQKIKKPQIIANPNCSTIQLVTAVKPLHKQYGINRIFVASYQASSGAGLDPQKEFLNHLKKPQPPIDSKYFARSLAFNVIPQIGSFDFQGLTSEELKIQKETKKILADNNLDVSAFTVRVPVMNGHSEAIWIELKKSFDLTEIGSLLANSPGLIVAENFTQIAGFTPREVSGHNQVYVARIHRHPDNPYLLKMWVVADNLRKGAATNAIQIAKAIFLK